MERLRDILCVCFQINRPSTSIIIWKWVHTIDSASTILANWKILLNFWMFQDEWKQLRLWCDFVWCEWILRTMNHLTWHPIVNFQFPELRMVISKIGICFGWVTDCAAKQSITFTLTQTHQTYICDLIWSYGIWERHNKSVCEYICTWRSILCRFKYTQRTKYYHFYCICEKVKFEDNRSKKSFVCIPREKKNRWNYRENVRTEMSLEEFSISVFVGIVIYMHTENICQE